MTEQNGHSPAEQPDSSEGRGDGASKGGTPVPKKRGGWRRFAKWLRGIVLVLVLCVALGLATILYALNSDRGTRYVWQAATSLLGGRLSGTLDGGAISTGLRLRNVHWKGTDGTDIAVDSVSGQWELTRAPLRFSIDYLHVGTVDARIAPSPKSSGPIELPKDLRLPIELVISDVTLNKLRLHDGATTTELSRLALFGHSDGRHHAATVQRLDTPFGAVTAALKLDGGARPFPLTGDVGYSGKVSDETVQVAARLTGSLENLTADIDASGMKLTGNAHVEAEPFGEVPLKRALVTVDHVNPQAFSASAPFADLALRAELKPDPAKPDALVVSGPVSIVNAKPGSVDKKLIPLIDAQANVKLDASEQTISELNVRLLKDATLTGGGTLKDGKGEFDLKVAKLDLSQIESTIRPTQFGGPIGIKLTGDTQTITLDLNDAKAALRAQGKITLDAKQTAFDAVKVSVGKGRIELSGALKKDVHSSYDLKAKFVDFNPLLLSDQLLATPPPAKGAKKPAARPRTIEARVNGTLAATGVLAPTLTTKAQFKLGESVYDNLPLTGAGTVQVVGTRILPSNATLSIAGNNVDLNGSFGTPSDRLRFRIDAPQLERLCFGLAGSLQDAAEINRFFSPPQPA